MGHFESSDEIAVSIGFATEELGLGEEPSCPSYNFVRLLDSSSRRRATVAGLEN